MIYLDHNATTPVAPAIIAAMLPYWTDDWGNAASSYRFGAKLKSTIEAARDCTSSLIGASASEVLFTSCGTESNNAAINAALLANPQKKHLITCVTEHSSVLSHFQALEKRGYAVTFLPVNRQGLLNVDQLAEALTDNTALVSLMWANNETGVISPINQIGQLCNDRGVSFHCDAVQAVGKVSIDFKKMPIDYLSLTGHKIGAPKGIGALAIKKRVKFFPYLFGGHQERERRGGTENVALIVGLAEAAKLAKKNIEFYQNTVTPLRDYLESELIKSIDNSEVNGSTTGRLCNTTNLSFLGVASEPLLLLLDQAGICASSGSACLADSEEPSHVIESMKPGTGASKSALRLSLGTSLSFKDCEQSIAAIVACVKRLRA